MSNLKPKQTLVVLNSTEWLNLIARGSIRISKRRAISVSDETNKREMDRLFVSAPFTNIESSVDLFVLNLNDDWRSHASKHRSFPSEILCLNLSDVVAHHPVAEENFEYYSNISRKHGVVLNKADFETQWLSWVTDEVVESMLSAAEMIQSCLGIPLFHQQKRLDKYKWNDLCRLILQPQNHLKSKPSHVELLLRSMRDINDAVASSRDYQSFYLACAIEWIDCKLKKDPLDRKGSKDLLSSTLSESSRNPIGRPSDEVSQALSHLSEAFPKAFTNEITPLSVGLIIRIMHEIRTERLETNTIMECVEILGNESPPSTLLSFILAGSLGIELTNQFIIEIKK